MPAKIAIYLSPKADDETRQRFFQAIDQISELLKFGIPEKNSDKESRIRVGTVEKWDVLDSVVWLLIYKEEHSSICKSLARLILERHNIGDKYEIILYPKTD